LIQFLVSECDDVDDCDVTSLTSLSHMTSSMTSPIDAPWALSYIGSHILHARTPKSPSFRDI